MTFFRSIAFVTLMLSSAVCSVAEKLNIVLIMADDVGYECFSAYGSKEFSTPRLDALAANYRFLAEQSTPAEAGNRSKRWWH